MHLPYSSHIVEALAVARAISFGLELGSSPFILEGDSEIVIKDLISTDVSFSPCGHFLTLAKATTAARHVRCFFMWMEDVHPHLQSLLSTDYD